MKSAFNKINLFVAIILMGTLFGGKASAACGDLTKIAVHPSPLPQSWAGRAGYLLRVQEDQDATIVGMWHAKFIANTQNGAPISDTQIDDALVLWHRDKTEVMNSARPPQDGNFCMGVWEKTGKSSYKLNHFAWLANDTSNAPYGIGTPSGPTHIVEEVTLSPDGMHYSGSFTLTAYDASGHIAVVFTGTIAAIRITLQTTVEDLL